MIKEFLLGLRNGMFPGVWRGQIPERLGAGAVRAVRQILKILVKVTVMVLIAKWFGVPDNVAQFVVMSIIMFGR